MNLKRGFVREDGMVYLRTKKGVQIWGTKADWERMEKTRIEYMEKRRIMYRALPSELKYKIGQYNPETKLYFIRKSGNLSPMWGTKHELDMYRLKRKEMRLSYINRLKSTKNETKNSYGIRRRRGDIDPILNLVFFKYNTDSGKEMWMSKEKWEDYKRKNYKRIIIK